jgi:Hemolysin activation/secretion protein
MKKRLLILLPILIAFLVGSDSFAQPPRTSQEMSGIERTDQLIREDKALEKKITKKKEKPEIEEAPAPEAVPAPPSEKILVKNINVTDVTLISKKDIRKMVEPFENKELTLTDMQKVADIITDAYRKIGFITSRAYLPPQKIESGELEIRAIEGKMGDVEVKGNYYYKSLLFKKKLTLKKGEPFNYYILSKSLRRINEQPDRTAKAVLVPGKEPGATDVLLEVKEDLPIHAAWDFDNYGSRYIYNNRYQFSARHNNLLGMEDILEFKYMISEASAYRMIGGSYVLPVTDKFKLGFSAMWSKLRLLDDYKALDVRGKSGVYSLFATQNLFYEDNFNMNLNFGLDVKDIFNYQFDQKTSSDKMRVARIGFDADVTDPYGRTVMSNEVNIGLPGFMGGLKAKDPRASVIGSGGEFVKFMINLFRLQPMPLSSMVLIKNQLQMTSKTVTATEQYQIGGIINVRGYPSAELVGDAGFSNTVEWYFPPYFMPKDLKIPFTKTTFYDAVRIYAFYDYGMVHLRTPGPTAKEFDQLSDFGFGVRMSLPKNFSVKAEFACPINQKPSDGKDIRTWLAVSASY